MTRKLLKTVAIVVIAPLRRSPLEVPRRMVPAFTAAVSVAEALVTRLPRRQISVWWVFRRLLSRLLWRLLPWLLRIRPLLSDRVRDHLLLLITQTPRESQCGVSHRSPGLLSGTPGAQARPDPPFRNECSHLCVCFYKDRLRGALFSSSARRSRQCERRDDRLRPPEPVSASGSRS